MTECWAVGWKSIDGYGRKTLGFPYTQDSDPSCLP
jgi:hypothetical protein